MKAGKGKGRSPEGTNGQHKKTLKDTEKAENLQSNIDHIKAIREEFTPTAPIPHRQLLDQLKAKVKQVDFLEKAGLDEAKDLKNMHLQVIAVEELLRLARLYEWGLCKKHDFVYLFNGAYWALIEKEDLKGFLGESAALMGVNVIKSKHHLFRDNLLKQFEALAYLPTPPEEEGPVKINLLNGTFEINSTDTKLREFRREDFLTYQLPFEYDPKAQSTLFNAYLNRVLPDPDSQKVLAEFLGFVFIPHGTLKLEKALLLYGTGANGKSVFFEIVNAILGPENISHSSLENLTNSQGYHLAMLANRLVNYSSEINGKIETAIFKQLASGEPVNARLPYGKPFTLRNYAKLIFNCNELPRNVEHTNAYFRRFLIIPFEVTIPEEEQDKELSQKIISGELAGVFNWILAGLKRLLEQRKFSECEAIRQQVEQYKLESDSVKLFLEDEGYSPSQEDHITLKQLFAEYRAYCRDNGYSPGSQRTFSTRMRGTGFNFSRRNYGTVVHLEKKLML